MQVPVAYNIFNQQLWLSAQRAIYWEEEKALILSDLHFGKTGHFRKWGIAVPQNIYKEDLQRLLDLLHHFKPSKLIVVGDFFHSDANVELDWFKKWREDFATLQIILVKGNHDILRSAWYQSAGIEIVHPHLLIDKFLFTHERCDTEPGLFSFCGHIHPGIALQGQGKQTLRFPCFYFTNEHCILPAFSKFTGTVAVSSKAARDVFAIVDEVLVRF